MQDILNYSFYNNTVISYLSALLILVCGIAVLFVFKKLIFIRLKKWAAATETSIDDFLLSLIEKLVIPAIHFWILYIALHTLKLTPEFARGMEITAMIVMVLLVVRALLAMVNYLLQSSLSQSNNLVSGEKQLKGIRSFINFAIWVIALVFLLDNLGVKVSAVVAGLGIGGIAVALAAQAVLGDLFSYFVIFFDKPFELGDFIIIGDKMGVVEDIGIKTTRIRAIGGEQLILSNTDLTNSRVHNFKKMEQRRVNFSLGVIYQTSLEQLKRIPEIVENAVNSQSDATFDRGHFASYGDFSLNFEFVYYVVSSDYKKYMDIQQAINLTIFEVFEKEGIEFAYPTQTVLVSKNL